MLTETVLSYRRSLGGGIVALCLLVSMTQPAWGDPSKYEPAVDPSLGFNLISWWNWGGSGPAVWANSVQSLYDAGFRQVSINPERYFDPNTGVLAASSQHGPELSHIAAGIARAKSLGMTVTVSPYIEFQDFTDWRGSWDPTPGSAISNQFWSDYQQYLVDVAQLANAYGVDSMNVAAELRGLVQNPGNNAHWNAAINAVAANFSGQLGYAAVWNDYQNGNLTGAIWNHPAIDYMGVNAYFPVATAEQADVSGTDPNPAFINLLTDNWNAQLDGNILPFAHSLKGGNGMPVVLSEMGLLPYNRATAEHFDVIPSTSYPDQDEQIMGFKAMIAAMDHRKANDNLLSIDIWQWEMPGSNGSLWNMDVALPTDQPLNVPATQYLADFITHPIPEPSSLVLAALGIFGVLVLALRTASRT